MAQAPRPDAALRRVFDEHHDAVHRYCLRRLDVEDANEATAEVFVVAWRRVDSIPDGPGALPWLYGVARNVVRNQRRSRRRSVRLASLLSSMAEVPPEQPEAQVVRHSEVVEMHDALGRLRPQDRELLRLKTWEELSNKEIGEILGMSVRAVEGRYARLLKKLAKALPGGLGSMPQLAEEAGER